MTHFKTLGLLLSTVLLCLFGCKTEDVKPIINTNNNSLVKLSVSSNTLSEDAGVTQLIVSLNELSSGDVKVYFKFSGTASYGVDYTCNDQITISAGSLQNQSSLLSIQDTLKESNETIVISIDSVVGGLEDGNQSVVITLEDDDSNLGGNLIINEVLYDPSNNGLEGDANGDGVYAQNEDEFVEFFNNSSKPINIGGFKIYDATGLTNRVPRHVVASGTIIAPNKAYVVFGGGTLTGTFGNATVEKSTTGDLNLNNAGDFITVEDSSGLVVVTFDITPLSDNPNESYTRDPDITGGFVQHAGLSNGFKFSPGTRNNRTAF